MANGNMTLDVSAHVNQKLVDQIQLMDDEAGKIRDQYNDLYVAVENYINDPGSTGNENRMFIAFEAARARRLKEKKAVSGG